MNTHSSNGVMDLTANAVKLKNLTNVLSNQLDRNVIDKTGLTGEYDLHLKWTPDNAPQPIADDAPPLLFTAIQEQLGLKLQPGKGPVDTLVVDHVDQPTEN
jgi:bla regulator protein blaR1